MKKSDMNMILDNFKREELPELMNISSISSLPYHIPYIERLVRSSEYYEIWRAWIKRYEDGNIDILENLDVSELDKTKIELHHTPLTLYDICDMVGTYLLEHNKQTTPYEITKVVLEEHLLGNIGYVPLLITDHTKFHDGLLDIEEDKIKGNYKEFINKYTL